MFVSGGSRLSHYPRGKKTVGIQSAERMLWFPYDPRSDKP